MIPTLEKRTEQRLEPLPVPAAPLKTEEVADLHADDRHAAAAVCGVMMAIFTMGLLGYVFIFLWVLAYPM